MPKEETRTEYFVIAVTKSEFRELSEKAKTLRMSRPDMVLAAVRNYEKELGMAMEFMARVNKYVLRLSGEND